MTSLEIIIDNFIVDYILLLSSSLLHGELLCLVIYSLVTRRIAIC